MKTAIKVCVTCGVLRVLAGSVKETSCLYCRTEAMNIPKKGQPCTYAEAVCKLYNIQW
jgi:hypothetical protein